MSAGQPTAEADTLADGSVGTSRDNAARPQTVQAEASEEPDSGAFSSKEAPRASRPGVLIPAGKYSLSQRHRKIELEAFHIDLHEATVREYAECVGEGACTEDGLQTRPRCNWGRADRLDHPINCVSAEQARSFCHWVGERLLTEDEWEAAAALDGYPELLIEYQIKHPGSPWLPNVCFNKESFSHDPGGDEYGTCPIGQSILGSMLGLQDMVGNVSEWTEASCIGRNQTDPAQDCSEPVLRGSAWEGDLYRTISERPQAHLRRDHIKGIRCGRTTLAR